ncbi:MAG: 2OG-Fe(II) oxygenase [Alphaproteobacteria bacterium]|nr:2OG-Fe(II) oxygenase [Alphaproteobacteria bacterium]
MTASSSPPGAELALPLLSDEELTALGEGRVVVRDAVVEAAALEPVRALLDDLWRAGALRAAGVGGRGTRAEAVRGDHTTWLDDHLDLPDAARLWRWFDGLRGRLAEALRVALPSCRVQLARYPEGAHYRAHVDALRDDPVRRLTAILYLDPGWTPEAGGALQVVEGGEVRRIAPVGGRLVLFRADAVEHEVLPTSGPRYAATAWLGARPRLAWDAGPTAG